MKVILLAGGFGTRLSEYTESIPKPMVTVGGRPILWLIMRIYAHFGHKDFYLALGYKAEVIKEVNVTGNNRITDETILVFGAININEDYNAKKEEILKNM